MTAPATNRSDELLDTKAVAELLGRHPTTIAEWRLIGEGPAYIKIGKGRGSGVRYRRSDLDAWFDANTIHPGE